MSILHHQPGTTRGLGVVLLSGAVVVITVFVVVSSFGHYLHPKTEPRRHRSRNRKRQEAGKEHDGQNVGVDVDDDIDNKDKNDDDGTDSSSIEYPPHLQRELYKQTRRQKLLPKLTMDGPLYHNIRMYDPRGVLLSTISNKKAKWYVSKNLAVWQTTTTMTQGDGNENHDNNNHQDNDIKEREQRQEEEGDVKSATNNDLNKSIRLLFEPKGGAYNVKKRDKMVDGRSHEHADVDIHDDDYSRRLYNQSIKKNQCVSCGSEVQYMRHYVVPMCYRSLFPIEYKNHLPHDVVLLCADCHLIADQASQKRQHQIEYEARYHYPMPTSEHPVRVDQTLYNVQSAAKALLKWKHHLPNKRIQEYEELLRDFYRNTQEKDTEKEEGNGQDDEEEEREVVTLDEALLRKAMAMEYRLTDDNYVSGPELVVRALLTTSNNSNKSNKTNTNNGNGNNKDVVDTNITNFVRGWRQHFIDTMRPKFLPTGWDVRSAVKCDRRRK